MKDENNMDNRLDLINYLKDYSETMTEDDSLFLVSFNRRQGDSFVMNYNWEYISGLLSVGEISEESEAMQDARSVVLNVTANICHQDKEIRDTLLEALMDMED